MITVGDNPYAALEIYASAVGKSSHARNSAALNGWCSWFYTLAQVSEAEVIANTEYAAKHLKPFGLEYIQIDEGYQRWHGDWQGNQRFPNGMKWLADQIKSYSFKAGLWISPYVISEPTEIFRNHKDWLVKRADGSLQRVGNWTEPPADEDPKRYCLDVTHPGAAQWLHDLIDMIVNEWGYEMIKIDFVAWSILSAERYYDPTLSSAQVYRKGMEIMRNAAGDKCHILECGPGAITVGLIDSMRIELDVNYGFNAIAWSTYFTDPFCSASAAAKRYYFHKRTWINDVDHVCLHLLNNQQSEAVATIIALSGGNMISGDRLTQLDLYKLQIIQRITPSLRTAATPIDLFDSDMPSAFALKVKRSFGEWTIVGFFNRHLEESREIRFTLDRLWLDPTKTYVAFDFWKQQFMGDVHDELKLVIPPGSVTLLALHEKSSRPHVISTDRHFSQGAIEVEDVKWDDSMRTLSGVSLGPLNTSHNVSVYIPGKHPWTWTGSGLFRDYDSYSLKLVHENIMQVHVRFNKDERVQWSVKVDDIDK
jgi:alpha-galactosidase